LSLVSGVVSVIAPGPCSTYDGRPAGISSTFDNTVTAPPVATVAPV